MKKLVVVLGTVVLIGFITYPVFAHGPEWRGGGPGYCWEYDPGYSNLTAEQQIELDEQYRNFYNETNDLSNEVWSRSRELNALLNSPDPDVERAKVLQREISDLRARTAQKRLELEFEERKILPDAPRYAWGYGRHMSGYGTGWHMRGNGSGGCWY